VGTIEGRRVSRVKGVVYGLGSVNLGEGREKHGGTG